jgi:hypothetical protein
MRVALFVTCPDLASRALQLSEFLAAKLGLEEVIIEEEKR